MTSELLEPFKLFQTLPNSSNLSKHLKQVEHFESVRLLYELKEWVLKIEFKGFKCVRG